MHAYTLAFMTEMTWWNYVVETTDDAPQTDIARHINVDKGTIWRWKHHDVTPTAEVAIRFARAYRRPVAEALVAAGFITVQEARITEIIQQATAADLTDEELTAELQRRLLRVRSTDAADQ